MHKSKIFVFSTTILLVLCLSANVLTDFGQTTVPVPNASVEASGVNTSSSGSAISDSQGSYTITTWLDTDTYSVTASAVGFIDTTVNNVAVTAGATKSGVNILMPVSGGISGKVTDVVSSAPISSAIVTAVNTTANGGTGFAITDSNGNYQIITNLPTGTYNVSVTFVPGHIDQTKTSISVTAGTMTSNIDFVMARRFTHKCWCWLAYSSTNSPHQSSLVTNGYEISLPWGPRSVFGGNLWHSPQPAPSSGVVKNHLQRVQRSSVEAIALPPKSFLEVGSWGKTPSALPD